MTTTGPSDQELAKKFWKGQYISLRHKLEENNPDMVASSAGAKPWRAVQEAATAGASTRAFMQAFEGDRAGSGSQKVNPTEVATAKARIVESLVQQGRDAAYIEDVMNRVSPHLDIFAMTSDPAVQSVLLQRLVNGNSNQNFGLKDLVEATRLIHDVRNTPQQPQTDVAGVANAMTNALKTGAELAKTNSSDPVQMLQMLSQTQRQAHERELSMFERLLENSQPRSLREQLGDLRGVQ